MKILNLFLGLSVDMAVFLDLMKLRLPGLSKHLDDLQNDANDGCSRELFWRLFLGFTVSYSSQWKARENSN